MTLSARLDTQQDRLLNCVHCGFCLPACPTYNRLGDEADSPRGRLHLMRAVLEGRLDPSSDAFQTHIDRCLGCRACETVCPSGVEYGLLLEAVREEAVSSVPAPLFLRVLLGVFGSVPLTRLSMLGARLLRWSRVDRLSLAVVPRTFHRVRLGLAMLGSTRAPEPAGAAGRTRQGRAGPEPAVGPDRGPGPAGERETRRVGLLDGCVQAGLFRRVNEATARVLAANGYEIVRVRDQGCCGALHAHAGFTEGARRLARRNVEAFERAGVDAIAVNAAGCGAAMKGYGHLLEGDPEYGERARRLAAAVLDVSELLARAGPVTGGALPISVAYDAPCHLLHAQRISEEPLAVLRAVPGLELVPLPGSDECCGGAGVYGITHPGLGGRIGGDKVDAVIASGAEAVATGNPGCMMQIGAGLRLRGASTTVWHPVELLDRSYRAGGLYAARSRRGGGEGS